MTSKNLLSKLKILDAFPKTQDDIKEKSVPSAVVSVIASVLMVYLFVSEFAAYVSPTVTEEVGVDVSFGGKIPININMTFPGLKCDDFGLDFIDVAGDAMLEVQQNLQKTSLSPVNMGGKGCNIAGFLLAHKVAGEFHVAFGRQAIASGHDSTQHIHRYVPSELQTFNASHIIHRLSFGDDFPGVVQTLDGAKKIVEKNTARFLYFISIVPTIYVYSDGSTVVTNQYSATENNIPIVIEPGKPFKQPGVYFKYDVSPYRVTYTQAHQSFARFITRCCALLGGVFVVAGLISTALYSVKNNLQLDKLLPSKAESQW